MNSDETNIKRFWSRVDKNGPNGCWIWTGSFNSKGYGQARWKGFSIGAHRLSLIIDGRNPKLLDACHHCDNPPCVNPSHLFVGTRSQNIRDAIFKGRMTPPAGGTCLTDEQVVEIKQSSKSVKELSNEYKTSRNTIYNILGNKGYQNK